MSRPHVLRAWGLFCFEGAVVASNPRQSKGSARRKLSLLVRSRGEGCGICHGLRGPIRYDQPSDARHPLSYVLDEIHPVCLWRQYGYSSPTEAALDPNNVQPAHWVCNAEKSGKDGYTINSEVAPLTIQTSRVR